MARNIDNMSFNELKTEILRLRKIAQSYNAKLSVLEEVSRNLELLGRKYRRLKKDCDRYKKRLTDLHLSVVEVQDETDYE